MYTYTYKIIHVYTYIIHTHSHTYLSHNNVICDGALSLGTVIQKPTVPAFTEQLTPPFPSLRFDVFVCTC